MANKALNDDVGIRAEAENFRQQAVLTLQVADITAAAEEEESRLEQVRNSQPVETQLGRLMVKKNMKIVDILVKWDSSGSGEVSKAEFRHHCRELGVIADSTAIDICFDGYDSVCCELHTACLGSTR